MKTPRKFPLSEAAKAANPNTPSVWQAGWRCAQSKGQHNFYSLHPTREEAEASAANCRGRGGRVSVFETLEELFDLPPEPRKSHPVAPLVERLQKAVTFFDDRLYEKGAKMREVRIMFNEILAAHGCTARPQD